MAFLYPELPRYQNTEDLTQVYNTLVAYAGELKFLLESRDVELGSTPATKIFSVVTVSEIGRPASGDIAFSISTSKFKGYVGNSWVDFH
jgi:hypothetical protein